VQDFDTAKRHVGMVLTQYDPDSSAAKKEFRSIKDYQKKVATLRSVCSNHLRAWVASLVHHVTMRPATSTDTAQSALLRIPWQCSSDVCM
jgi:hypothetical protein